MLCRKNMKRVEDVMEYFYEWYIEAKKNLDRNIEALESGLDKIIIGVASSSILLTVTFYKEFLKDADPAIGMLLKCSWVFFLLAIVFVLVANRLSIIALNKGNITLRDWYRGSTEKLDKGKLNTPDLMNNWAKLAHLCNYLAFFSLFFGLLFVVGLSWMAF